MAPDVILKVPPVRLTRRGFTGFFPEPIESAIEIDSPEEIDVVVKDPGKKAAVESDTPQRGKNTIGNFVFAIVVYNLFFKLVHNNAIP